MCFPLPVNSSFQRITSHRPIPQSQSILPNTTTQKHNTKLSIKHKPNSTQHQSKQKTSQWGIKSRTTLSRLYYLQSNRQKQPHTKIPKRKALEKEFEKNRSTTELTLFVLRFLCCCLRNKDLRWGIKTGTYLRNEKSLRNYGCRWSERLREIPPTDCYLIYKINKIIIKSL